MKKTPVYTALGFVSMLQYEDSKGTHWDLSFNKQRRWSKSNKKAVYVMLAKDYNEILLVRWNPTKTQIPKGAKNQKALLHNWSHWAVDGAWKIPTPRTKLKKVGHIYSIVYSSDKFERSGDMRGKFNFYQHTFTHRVPFYTNTKEDFFKFKYPRLLSDRGIIA